MDNRLETENSDAGLNWSVSIALILRSVSTYVPLRVFPNLFPFLFLNRQGLYPVVARESAQRFDAMKWSNPRVSMYERANNYHSSDIKNIPATDIRDKAGSLYFLPNQSTEQKLAGIPVISSLLSASAHRKRGFSTKSYQGNINNSIYSATFSTSSKNIGAIKSRKINELKVGVSKQDSNLTEGTPSHKEYSSLFSNDKAVAPITTTGTDISKSKKNTDSLPQSGSIVERLSHGLKPRELNEIVTQNKASDDIPSMPEEVDLLPQNGSIIERLSHGLKLRELNEIVTQNKTSDDIPSMPEEVDLLPQSGSIVERLSHKLKPRELDENISQNKASGDISSIPEQEADLLPQSSSIVERLSHGLKYQMLQETPSLNRVNNDIHLSNANLHSDSVSNDKQYINDDLTKAKPFSIHGSTESMPELTAPRSNSPVKSLSLIVDAIEKLVPPKVETIMQDQRVKQEKQQTESIQNTTMPHNPVLDLDNDEAIRGLMQKIQDLAEEENFRSGKFR